MGLWDKLRSRQTSSTDADNTDQSSGSGAQADGKTVLRVRSSELDSASQNGDTRKLPPHLRKIQTGDPIARDLLAVKKIGSGQMGDVYLAHHRQWNIDVAVKVPNDAILADIEHVHRVMREAEIWTNLGLHPNIAYCYFAFPVEDVPLIVVEYVDGGNLRDWIADGRCAGIRESLDLAIQLCHALEHAHQHGLIHRDVKPENILMTTGGLLKLTDFGIARLRGLKRKAGMLVTGAVDQSGTVAGIGTPSHMAPEQFDSAEAVDERADIFAAGVCLYEMLAGRRPYASTADNEQVAPDPNELRQDIEIPESLSAMMQRMVAWKVEKREASLTRIRDVLCGVYQDLFGVENAYSKPPEQISLADCLNNQAVSYWYLGKSTEARQAWKDALRDDPVHFEATFNSLYSGESEDYRLDKLKRLEPYKEQDPRYWKARAWIDLEIGEVDEASKLLHTRIAGDDDLEVALEDASRETPHVNSPVGQACALAEDGTTAVVVGDDIQIWDLTENQCVATYPRPEGVSQNGGVSINERGEFFFTTATTPAGQLAIVRLEISTGEVFWLRERAEAHRFSEGQSGDYHSLLVSPCGRFALTQGVQLSLWDLQEEREIGPLGESDSRLRSFGFSADEDAVVTLAASHTVTLWSLDGRKLRQISCGTASTENYHWHATLSDDCRFAVFGSGVSYPGTTVMDRLSLEVWDLRAGRRCWVRNFKGFGFSQADVRFSPDGHYLFFNSGVLELSQGKTIQCLERPSKSPKVTTRDGTRALADLYGTFSVVEVPQIRLDWAEVHPFPMICDVGSSSDVADRAQIVAAALQDASARMKGREHAQAIDVLREAQEIPGYARDKKLIAAINEHAIATGGRRVSLRDAWLVNTQDHSTVNHEIDWTSPENNQAAQQKSLKTEIDGRSWTSSCYSSSGCRVAGNVDGYLQVWEARTGVARESIKLCGSGINVMISGMDDVVIVGARNKMAYVVDLTGENETILLKGHTLGVTCMALTDGGKRIVSGGNDGQVIAWDAADGREISRVRTGGTAIEALVVSPDSRFVFCVGAELILCDLATGAVLKRLDWDGAKFDINPVFSTDLRYAKAAGVIIALDWDWEFRDDERSEKKLVTVASCTCGKQLRVPTDRGRLKVTCPACKRIFEWEPPSS